MRDGAPLGVRFSEGVDRLVAFMEKDRLSVLGIFLYVLTLSVVRDISEYYLLDRPFVIEPHPWVYSIAHHVAFYFLTFLGIVLLLSAFTQRGVRRSLNFVTCFFWIILLPPFLDHFLFGADQNYAYFSPTDFLNYLMHFSGSAFHPGQGLEIVVVVFAVFGYGVWTERKNLDTVNGRAVTALRVGLLVVFTFVALFIMATPGAYLPVGSTGGVPDFPNFGALRYYQYHLFIFAYYAVLGLVLMFSLVYLARRSLFQRIAASMRPAQTVFFLGVVLAGMAMGWTSSGGSEYVLRILDYPYWVNLEFTVVTLCSAFLAWQVSAMWNDLADRTTDSPFRRSRVLAAGEIDAGAYAQASVVLAAVAVLLAFLLSLQQGLVVSAILALSYLYSMRPFRLKGYLLSPALIGLGTFLAFFLGFLTPYSVMVHLTNTPTIPVLPSVEVVVPAITATGLLTGLYMFLGLVVGSMITDVDGFLEDSRGQVRTVYTVLGLEQGVKAVSVLIFLASLTPLLMFHDAPDVLIFPVFGAAAAVAFYKKRSSRPVLLVALLGLLYAAVRFLQTLPH